MIVRVLLVVAALAAAAWVGTSLRAAQLESQAGEEVRAALGGGQGLRGSELRRFRRERTAHAAVLLERARKWAPYQAPVINEAGLLSTIGRQRRAVDLLNDLVRREPENPEAWGRLADILQRSDPARSRAARRRQLELNPPVGQR